MTHEDRPSIACLDCGYVLVSKSSVCSECGRGFDPANPATFRRLLHHPLRIARLPMTEAIAARIALERNGLHAMVEDEMGGIIGHIDIPRGSVWVERADEAAAIEILTQLVTRRAQSQPWICPRCNESIDAQFDACWSCGEERGEGR